MTEKEKFFEALKDDEKRDKIFKFLIKSSAKRKIEEFKKNTGYSLDEFFILLAEDKIKIIEIDNKIIYKCQCGTNYMIYRKEESINCFELRTQSDPLSVKSIIPFTEYFYCIKCGQRAVIYGEIKKIEVIF
jgi:hypothetical protein